MVNRYFLEDTAANSTAYPIEAQSIKASEQVLSLVARISEEQQTLASALAEAAGRPWPRKR